MGKGKKGQFSPSPHSRTMPPPPVLDSNKTGPGQSASLIADLLLSTAGEKRVEKEKSHFPPSDTPCQA